ncbi:hypothetical protein NKG05_20065 [Oerskovia sp. M15]
MTCWRRPRTLDPIAMPVSANVTAIAIAATRSPVISRSRPRHGRSPGLAHRGVVPDQLGGADRQHEDTSTLQATAAGGSSRPRRW